MKHHFLCILGHLACLVLLSGCISDPGFPQGAVPEETGRLLGQKILDSIREKNYIQLSSLLSQYGGPSLTKEEYLRSEREFSSQFGTIVSFRYLTDLQTPGVLNLLWVVALERQSAMQDEKRILQELLFRLVITKIGTNGKVRILGMGFF